MSLLLKRLPIILAILTMSLYSVTIKLNNKDNDLLNFSKDKDNNLKYTTMFEPQKDNKKWDGVEFRLNFYALFGYQIMNQDGYVSGPDDSPVDLDNGTQLPNADLTFSMRFAKGINVYFDLMFASTHHDNTFSGGGYAKVDNLDFIYKGFLAPIMHYVTLRAGYDNIGYGDAQYFYSKNAIVMNSPFISNIMTAASEAKTMFIEAIVRLPIDTIVTYGVAGGAENPDDALNNAGATGGDNDGGMYAKIAYDNKSFFIKDLRFRVSASSYASKTNTGALYAKPISGRGGIQGDGVAAESGFGGINDTPWDAQGRGISDTLNFYTEYKGLGFLFGYDYVFVKEKDFNANDKFSQYYADLVYRFGPSDKFYLAGRWNWSKLQDATSVSTTVNSISKEWEIGAGWFLLPNILIKAAYINVDMEGQNEPTVTTSGWLNGEAKYNGVVFQASVAF